jgi:hypothetical protein
MNDLPPMTLIDNLRLSNRADPSDEQVFRRNHKEALELLAQEMDQDVGKIAQAGKKNA